LVKVGPTIRPQFGRDCPGLNVCSGIPSGLANVQGRHFWGWGRHYSTCPGAALPHVGALAGGKNSCFMKPLLH